jgi:hypothetical protein
MAEFAFVDGGIPTAANWNANVRDQLTIICTSSTRPGSPTTGRRIYETDTGLEYVYTGAAWTLCGDNSTYSAWTSYTPSWTTGGTQPAIGNGTYYCAYKLIGKTLHIRFGVVFGTTSTFGTGQWAFSLPASKTAVVHSFTWGRMRIGASGYYWPVHAYASSSDLYLMTPTGSGDTRLAVVSATSPDTWTSTTSNELFFNITVEVS